MAEGGPAERGCLLSMRRVCVCVGGGGRARAGWARLLAHGSEAPRGLRSRQCAKGGMERHGRWCVEGVTNDGAGARERPATCALPRGRRRPNVMGRWDPLIWITGRTLVTTLEHLLW